MKQFICGLCIVCVLCPVCAGAVEAAASKPPSPQEALDRETTDAVIKGTLREAMAKLQGLAGVPFRVEWAALAEAGVKDDAKVLVKTSRAKVSQLLSLALIQVAVKGSPLAWHIEGNSLRVTTQNLLLFRKYLPPPGRRPATTRPAARSVRVRHFSFENTPVTEVLDFLTAVSGVNFHVNWRALESVGIVRETPVTFSASGITVARALDLVTDQLSANRTKYDSVYWVIDEGVLTIATGTALDATLRVRVYDVGDLLHVVPNFRAPRMELGGRSAESDTSDTTEGTGLFDDDEDESREEDLSPAQQRKKTVESLIKIIKGAVGEDMWAPQGKGSITLFQRRLVVSQTLLGFKLLEKSLSSR